MKSEVQTVSRPGLPELLASAEQRRLGASKTLELTECLLEEIHASLSARSVRLWGIAPDAPSRLLDHKGLPLNPDDRFAKSALPGLVRHIRAEQGGADSETVRVASCEIADGMQAVLEVHLTAEADDQLLLELSEVFADLHRRKLVASFLAQSSRDQTLRQIITLLHSDLDAVRVANCLASDANEFLNCRRISIARRTSGHRWDLVAATAVSSPDPRSDAARWLSGLIETESSRESTGSLPVSNSPERGNDPDPMVIIRPLTLSGRWSDAQWAVVFELMSGSTVGGGDPSLPHICRHAALSLQNCEIREQSGWRHSLFGLPRAIRQRRMIMGGVAGVVVLAGLTFWQTELRIEVSGRLVPSERAFVFAPEDGVVTEVLVADGSSVSKGTVLCRLRNEDLEIQLEALEGDLASTTARLSAIESLRGDRSISQSGLMSAEQAELQEKQSSLEAQAAILSRRIERLSMNSRLSGLVFGDRLQETLRGRPVQRGQYLFEVANPASGWELDLRIPESDVRHVLKAKTQSASPLEISYALETTPDLPLSTTLAKISAGTEVDEFGRLSTSATAVPENASIQNARPGAGVVAQIDCGERAVGYVFFRRIIEAVQRRWWL